MTEYNERLLKNVLQDYREEQNAQLLKEKEEAKNNPLFQNKEGEAEAFAQKYSKKQKKKSNKIFLKVASILLVMAIGCAFIPFTVEGQKSSLAEIIANFINSEFVIFGNNENDNLLLSYGGEFFPTFIPDGYKVTSVINEADKNEIVFTNDDMCMLIFKEQSNEIKTNIDYAEVENVKNVEILGFNGSMFEKNGIHYLTVITEFSVINISCEDSSVDLLGFAQKIEKR